MSSAEEMGISGARPLPPPGQVGPDQDPFAGTDFAQGGGGSTDAETDQSAAARILTSSGSSSIYSGIVGGLIGGVVGLLLFLAVNAAIDLDREARQIILAITVPGMVALAVIGWPELVAGNIRAAVSQAGKAMMLAITGGILGLIIADWMFFSARENQASDRTEDLVLIAGFGAVSAAVGFATGLNLSSRRALVGLVGGLFGGLLAGIILLRLGGSREMEPGKLILAIPVGTLLLGAAVGGAERLGRQTWIEIVDGTMAGREINLYRNPSTIGSSPTADVVLSDAGVAPQHASIVRHGDVVWIDSLAPGADTRINQHPLTARVQLNPDDLIRIGGSYLVVKTR